MKKLLLTITLGGLFFISLSFKETFFSDQYASLYDVRFNELKKEKAQLVEAVTKADLASLQDVERVRMQLTKTRDRMKAFDFWMRYLEPITYKKINGPLPVEWETEVFEKFEKPYKREGAGLTLAELYLDEPVIEKQKLMSFVMQGQEALSVYGADSIRRHLNDRHHFFLCNRLHLLNLATIYTTGFECPNPDLVIPELEAMMRATVVLYQAYNESFSQASLSKEYLELYGSALEFVKQQSKVHEEFDHFTFIRDYVNPLFALNQHMIREYKVVSRSYIDYSLSKQANAIFSKNLYHGQNSKGIFIRVQDPQTLAEIDRLGKLLFYDPILSGNNKRSCASCHKPTEYFTDTAATTALQFNGVDRLHRNTPSLINVEYNHLIMLDGKHISLQDQTKGVMFSEIEMGTLEAEALKKVMSCKEYKTAFQKLLRHTPQEQEVTLDHIVSAITFYYSKFGKAEAPFDQMMNRQSQPVEQVQRGFNLFMSKAQCGTCHFPPQFNGVKPPYVNSEFEVLGVPEDAGFKVLSDDRGRYGIHPSAETLNGFRTGTLRNIVHTKPYMHNGVFSSLEEVIDFYDAGGGQGHGLSVENQTLSSDSLHLSLEEKAHLISFMNALDEAVPFEKPPLALPTSRIKSLNQRKVGGEY